MPCGGIEPLDGGAGTVWDVIQATDGGCWVCGRGGCKHFCHEWDTFIHAICSLEFLQQQEGQCIVHHNHTVVLDFSLEPGNVILAIRAVGELNDEQIAELKKRIEEEFHGILPKS